MADTNVVLKLSATEYRFLRSEMELHLANLHKRGGQRGKDFTMPPDIKERSDIRKRHTSLHKMLQEI